MLFPTPVGMNRSVASLTPNSSTVPHARGDESKQETVRGAHPTFSQIY